MEEGKALYPISKAESERIQFLRLLFCIMIVFIHSYTEEIHLSDGNIEFFIPSWIKWSEFIISQVISRCAVPAFFFLSAILLYRRDFSWSRNMKKKIQALMIPYVIVNTFWILFFYIVQHIGALSVFFASQENMVAQWGIYDWMDAYFGISGYPMLGPLWFLRDLFFLNAVSKGLKALIDKFPGIVFLVLVVILLSFKETHIFFVSSDGIVFFSLGYYAVKYGLSFKNLDSLNIVLAGAVYAACMAGCCLTYDMRFYSVIRAFTIVIGCMFFGRCSVFILKCSYRAKVMEIAKYNFSIYLFHELNLSILKKIWYRIFPPSAFCQFAAYFILPFFIIVCCIVFSRGLERFMPSVYSVITGCRVNIERKEIK